ncbi:MAG: glycosyltransferase, partial [Thermoleophilaceae bacterium]|nr:glycosyltransferase [Thermoleophilaceae bacterium]
MSPLVANASNDPQVRALQLDEAVQWAQTNTFAATQYTVGRLLELKGANSVAVVIPSREVAATIDAVVASAVTLRDVGLVDEVVVVDADSQDGSAAIASAFGATVHQEDFLMPEYGPVLGKGDAMWRALSVVQSTVVAFVDSDTYGFGDHFIRGLIGPLLEHDHLQLVKGAYRRPFAAGDKNIPDGGG